MRYVGTLKRNKFLIIVFLVLGLVSAGIFLFLTVKGAMPQAAIALLEDAPLPEAGQKVLVFTPHPDDETLGAGGLIIKSIQNNAEVEIVLVADGNKHGLKDERYREFKSATTLLGIPEANLVFLNYPDGSLAKQDQAELYSNLKAQIDSFRPDFVVYPHEKDDHPDHATVAREVDKIVTDENFKGRTYQYLIHRRYYPGRRSFRPSQYLLPPVSLVEFSREWARVMLPDDVEMKKEQAIEEYKSQLKTPILKGLMLSMVRKNEVFMTRSPID